MYQNHRDEFEFPKRRRSLSLSRRATASGVRVHRRSQRRRLTVVRRQLLFKKRNWGSYMLGMKFLNIPIPNLSENTMVKSFEVTELPVRSAKFIARKQWVVIGADDMYIRVYNYNTMDKVKVFEAHTDYIRCVAVHPTLPYVLSSSDDMLIKLWDWEKGWIWNLGSPDPNFTLDAHLKGVNCVDYFTGGDKPYLITGSDDHTAKVWDYQTKSCVQTLDRHIHNVSAVCFHPELPIVITGFEDGTVRIWHATMYWVVIGYDEGTIMVTDGERLPLAVKELGTCDLDPQIFPQRHHTVSKDIGNS
ncbi:hypothetical protein HYC85_020550 [Camellia sinensis]|uniref:Coatomer WD associated region domain-containing protein n=1 Tax=Camellia sinensis TaxID=4442 RepID=A0A7J7GTZ0_CAMSI|nr:hypothetical protein HYC85_020550 [Camellia sinensis]